VGYVRRLASNHTSVFGPLCGSHTRNRLPKLSSGMPRSYCRPAGAGLDAKNTPNYSRSQPTFPSGSAKAANSFLDPSVLLTFDANGWPDISIRRDVSSRPFAGRNSKCFIACCFWITPFDHTTLSPVVACLIGGKCGRSGQQGHGCNDRPHDASIPRFEQYRRRISSTGRRWPAGRALFDRRWGSKSTDAYILNWREKERKPHFS
jgi:hypothetical protein